LSTDTLTTIATGLTSAINADTHLQGIGVSATSSGTLITINSNSVNNTSYVQSVSSGATESITLGINPNGLETAAIGGTKTTGNVLTITATDAGLTGGSEPVNYTVLSTDTLTTIASAIAAAINADTHLSGIGVTATSSGTVVNIKSTSVNATTYTESTSGGATETITLGIGTGISKFSYNNVNELTGISAGGAARYQGNTNKAIKSATINSTTAATLNTSESFIANQVLSSGSNNTTVTAVDGGNNSVTNHYQVSVAGPASSTLTFDANGNMTSDGTNSYAWDAENRLILITYPGAGTNSQYTYDGLGGWVKIVETAAGTTISTKQFVWDEDQECPSETRDGTGAITAQYFDQGQTIGGTTNKYFYALDHLGSVRELTDSSGNIQAQYAYDPYGRKTNTQGSVDSDFQYAGYYFHSSSGLLLTSTRPYSPSLGRFINRDLIEEAGGVNVYAYANGDPVNFSDPMGTQGITVFKLTCEQLMKLAAGGVVAKSFIDAYCNFCKNNSGGPKSKQTKAPQSKPPVSKPPETKPPETKPPESGGGGGGSRGPQRGRRTPRGRGGGASNKPPKGLDERQRTIYQAFNRYREVFGTEPPPGVVSNWYVILNNQGPEALLRYISQY